MSENIKLKICGMRESENLKEISTLAPDFFGLIFYPKSPRFIKCEDAALLPSFPNINRIGVFVNETIENILRAAKTANLFGVQLHGDETARFCAEIKEQNPNLIVIKAFAVDEDFDGNELKLYENACDFFLFDTKTAARGGSGKNFDWRILQKLEMNRPFFLSGGIGLENVGEAIKACENLPIFALDVNSRAEIAPGVKSKKTIAEIIKNL